MKQPHLAHYLNGCAFVRVAGTSQFFWTTETREQRPLNEAIALYERGQALSKHCAALLEKAELKVRQLSGGDITAFETGE